MIYQPLELFALVTSPNYRGLLYINLMKQRLVAEKIGDFIHLSISGDETDSIKRIDVVVKAPKNGLVSKELVEYARIDDLSISIMSDFGVDGALIWATNSKGRLLTFPIADRYKQDIYDTIFA